jgi:hypothetical protein
VLQELRLHSNLHSGQRRIHQVLVPVLRQVKHPKLAQQPAFHCPNFQVELRPQMDRILAQLEHWLARPRLV